jgi:hypothetical protein
VLRGSLRKEQNRGGDRYGPPPELRGRGTHICVCGVLALGLENQFRRGSDDRACVTALARVQEPIGLTLLKEQNLGGICKLPLSSSNPPEYSGAYKQYGACFAFFLVTDSIHGMPATKIADVSQWGSEEDLFGAVTSIASLHVDSLAWFFCYQKQGIHSPQ